MLDGLQYRLLKRISPGEPGHMSGAAYLGKSKLEMQLGDMLGDLSGKTVIDFGCGEGAEAVELAQRGAARVIGLDIQAERLEVARSAAESAGVADRCLFAETTDERADLITSLDAFEHFDDPAAMLDLMAKLLKPDGAVVASFGPTWYHPLGGHLFSIFPWAHLLFSEKALMRWRNDLRDDGATCFREVAGGLNQMTIRRFERIVEAGPFRIERLQTVPIRKLRPLHSRLTRELTTAIVRCRLELI